MLTEEDQKEAMEYEEFLARINSIRNPSAGSKKWWEAPVFGSLMTAVLTAIITIGGGYFTQQLMKSNDFALDLFKSELTKKREFLDTTYNLIAEIMKANEERIFFAQGRYDEIPANKQNEMLEATNKAGDQWRTKGESAEFQVYLYYGKRPDVVSSWHNARKAIQQYYDCAEKVYLAAQSNLIITDQALAKLKSVGIPADVITKLQSIKNQKAIDEEGFKALLNKAELEEKQTAKFGAVILEQAIQGENAPANACQVEANQARQAHNALRDLMTSEYREQVFK